MDARTITRLKAQLEEERSRLAAEVAQLEVEERELLSEASGENEYRDHMADQGTATFGREMDMTFEENLRSELSDVEAALARLDSGSYGVCDRCGKTIPSARMQAVPTASLCITCKSADEHR